MRARVRAVSMYQVAHKSSINIDMAQSGTPGVCHVHLFYLDSNSGLSASDDRFRCFVEVSVPHSVHAW
eukprot:21970-Eustigmatos_ZCMA.PRE.1